MSTQFSGFWCFFHALCKYCAWRGAPKSITSGSLCSLSQRIHSQEEYCLSFARTLTSKCKSQTDGRMTNVLEETVRNHDIVLYRINEIASWMSFMSSEIHKCSWNISTMLEPSLVSSSSCHAYFLLAIRPMRAIQEIFLKIFEHSPEVNGSIFFSMQMLWMTKKRHFIWHFRIWERIFPWFNVNLNPSPNGDYSWWRVRPQVLLIVVLLWPSIGMQNPLHSVLTHSYRTDLLEFLFHCCSNSSQTHLIHGKFWPKSEHCLCSKTKFWNQLRIYRANNWLQLLIRVQCWCSLGSILLIVMLRLLLEECVHDRPLHEIVWDLQCLSSWSTIYSQQHSEILHPYKIYWIYLVVTAFQFVLHIVATENVHSLGHHNPKELLSWSHWARAKNLIVPSQRVAPFSREGIHTLHISLRLLRKDWAGLQIQLCEK